MKKCYLDRQLRVTDNVMSRKAIVTEVPGWIEITFLEPIAHNKEMSAAWRFLGEWGKRTYPRYSFHFPSLEVCLLANQGEAKPPIVSCFTSSICRAKKSVSYYCIEADGSFGQEKTLAENVYASFLMHPGEFYFLNAGVDLQKYQTRWYL